MLCSGLSACRKAATETETPFVSPISTTIFDSPLAKLSDNSRTLSAFNSFELAQARAQVWNPQYVWYGIMPSKLMQENLGIPVTGRGWFFRFGLEENSLEYYVQVENGQVNGSTEAQPILVESLPYELLPIDMGELEIDSTQVLDTFALNGGAEYFEEHPAAKLDYRLLHVKGTPNPVWSLFDLTNLTQPLINVDAKTGAIVAAPFSSER